MNFRTTYLLFGALLASLVLFGLTQYLRKPPGDTADYVLPSFHEKKDPRRTSDVTTVEIKRNRPQEETLVFVRGEHGWRVQEPFSEPGVKADDGAVEDLIQQLTRARKETSADTKAADLRQFGLEPPAAVVTLRKDADQSWKVQVGDESPDKKVVYLSSSEVPGPLVVPRADLEALYKSLAEFRSKELLAVSPTNATALEVEAADAKDPKKKSVLAVEQKDGRWAITKPFTAAADFDGEGAEAKERLGVKGLLQAVGNVRVESTADFVKDEVRDLAEYGLDDKQVTLRIKATYNPEGRVGTDPNKPPVTATLLVGKKADEKGEKVYARLDGERSVVRVSAKALEPIRRAAENPDALRDRDLLQADAGRVDAIDIKQGKTTLKLRRVNNTWKLYAGADKPVDADAATVRQLLDALTAKRQVKEFPSAAEAAKLGLDKPGAETTSISLWEGGLEEKTEDGKEPKLKEPDKPKVRLTFGREDPNKGTVAVRRKVGDAETVLEVTSTLLPWANKGRLAYLERKLPGFAVGTETRLVLTRPDGVYEVEKEKKDEKSAAAAEWKFKQPKPLAGRRADAQAVNAVLRTLSELHPTAWTAEKPSDKELEAFGLKPPQLTATVTLPADDKKTTERTYLFGKKTKDGGVYAKLNAPGDDRNLVFEVRPDVLTTLGGELRDRTLFAFEPAKVRGLKLTGWKNKYKSFVVTLELVRSAADKPWTVKAGPNDFKLEAGQVDEFVKDLSVLKAERFVEKPPADLGLKTEAGGLQVEITLEGQKAPLTLTVGKEAEAGTYYGQSSSLPNEVLLLSRRLKKLLDDGVDYFSSTRPTS